VSLVFGGVEVWEGFRIGGRARRCRGAEGIEGDDGGDPGGDGGGEVFGEERAEGLVLPGLDVAGGPVVEEADAEDVCGGAGDGDGDAQSAGFSYVKCEFKFVV
jgi:hypothetical protein